MVQAIEVDATESTARETRASLLEEAQALEPLLRAAEEVIENERRIPQEITERLYATGIYRARLPRELGGLEVHPLEWLDAVEEISRVNGSVGWLCMLHDGSTPLRPDTMRELLTEHEWITASNVGRAAGKATKVDGGYRISGRWPFTSGSPESHWIGGSCILHGEDGEPLLAPRDGLPYVIFAFFPRSEVTFYDTWDGHGLRGTGSGDFEVMDVFVPEKMVNATGIWKRHFDRAPFRASFNLMAHGAHALGLARAAIDEFVGLVHVAARRGSYRQSRLGREPVHQYTLGKADTGVRAARVLLWDVVAKAYDAAGTQWPIDYELRVQMHAANLFAVHTARAAVDSIFQQAGAPAVFRGRRLERIHRDVFTAANHALMAETSYDRVGQFLLSKDEVDGPVVDIQQYGFVEGPHPQYEKLLKNP